MKTGLDEERLDAALRSLHNRYSGGKFTWSVSQKNGIFVCLITCIKNNESAQSQSTDLASAVENAVMMAGRQFVHQPVRGG